MPVTYQRIRLKNYREKCFAFISGIYQVVIGTFTFEEMIPQYHSFLVPQNYVCEKAKG